MDGRSRRRASTRELVQDRYHPVQTVYRQSNWGVTYRDFTDGALVLVRLVCDEGKASFSDGVLTTNDVILFLLFCVRRVFPVLSCATVLTSNLTALHTVREQYNDAWAEMGFARLYRAASKNGMSAA